MDLRSGVNGLRRLTRKSAEILKMNYDGYSRAKDLRNYLRSDVATNQLKTFRLLGARSTRSLETFVPQGSWI
jgi:hypothetical protein